MSFLWDLNQNLKIHTVQTDANRANYKADKAGRKAVASLESVERLTLILRAMWKLIEEHTDLTEEDLIKTVREIDLMDGRLDGKFKPDATPGTCQNCGNKVHPSQVQCQFCGKEVVNPDVFQKVRL